MGVSISFLSGKSPENGEPSQMHPTHRTKEQLIRDAESEAQVKLDRIRHRIRELERQKYVLVLSVKRIQCRLCERITRINKEHDEHDLKSKTVQTSLQVNDTEVATKVARTEGIVPVEPLETVQCVTSEINVMQSETHTVGHPQQPEAYPVTDTSDPDTSTAVQSETLVTEDRLEHTQQPEAYPVTDTSDPDTSTAVQSETLVTEDRVGHTQRPETYPVKDTSDPSTAANEPFMSEQEESLLNQLLHKKLNYIQSCDNGIDVNTGVPVMKTPHIYMTPLEKSLLNELGTMCLYDLWHGKGLQLKELYIRHIKSKTQPPVTEDTDDTLQEDEVQGQENVPHTDKSTQQLPEAHGQETTQLTNESFTQQLTNDSTCLCNSSPQILSTQRVTYCLSDMLASCSQPVGQKTIQVANKSPTSYHLSKRLERRRVQRAKKSKSREIKFKSNLSSQYVKSGNTPQDEKQKKPYACSYDPSFWRKIQCQPAIDENAEKENEATQNQPHSIASWRNASLGEKKTTVKVHPSANSIKLDACNRDVPYQDKTRSKQASVLNADEALKIAVEAIRRCPRVTSSVYRLEHLTNTLESQIMYLEAMSSFNMYLKAPLIMREVCAKLGPYFLWDWCKYANKIQARHNNGIHREMLNFLKKKVYCSTLYLRPYYEESMSDD